MPLDGVVLATGKVWAEPGQPNDASLVEFQDVTGVNRTALTTVLNYSVPGGQKLIVTGVSVGGEADGFWEVLLAGSVKLVLRTSNDERSKMVTFPEQQPEIAAAAAVLVRVTAAGFADDLKFESTLFGVLRPV